MQKQNNHNRLFFEASGKVLLSGEYLVLHGAEAFSLPVRFGQTLIIEEKKDKNSLYWKTIMKGELWFETLFSMPDLMIINTSDLRIARVLKEILLAARDCNPLFLNKSKGFNVISELNYNILWGLGSSSGLTVNIARWADIDPFSLHFKTSAGSGYDVATALAAKPILYKLENKNPSFTEIQFSPVFKNNIWFVYLGNKQKSADEIKKFERNIKPDLSREINEISAISRRITMTKNVRDFIRYLDAHDRIISRLKGETPLSGNLFSDFTGYAKYLGAWGGDFAMLVSSECSEYISKYLRKKEKNTWFSFEQMILN